MIKQIPFKRGGKNYIAFKGRDADGGNIEYIEEVDKHENGLTGRFFPTRKTIEQGTGNGNLSYILNVWSYAKFSNAGEMITTPQNYHHDFGTLQFRTNAADEADFTDMLGGLFSEFDFNGFVRAIMGFNKYKLFDTDAHAGAEVVLEWTPEQLAEPKTNEYGD